MATSIAFSAFLALSLTPALCATLLKPMEAGQGHDRRGFFGWFNRRIRAGTAVYRAGGGGGRRRPVRSLIVYKAILAALGWGDVRLPSSFLPTEDQGYVLVDAQTPPESSAGRTLDVVKRIEDQFAAEPGAANRTLLFGYGFSGQGQNAALAFLTLKGGLQPPLARTVRRRCLARRTSPVTRSACHPPLLRRGGMGARR